MSSKPYDTVAGIAGYLTSLAGLNRLIDERMRAGYDRRERLDDFVILGRWTTDACGNFSRIEGRLVPKDLVPDLPDVLPLKQLWSFLPADSSITSVIGSSVPPERLRCARCGQAWTLENCHDVHVAHKTGVLKLDGMAGRTLAQVKQAYGERADAEYYMQRDILVRSDRFIDPRPHPKYPDSKLNERGWVGERDGIGDNYVVQPGDEGFFNIRRYYHRECSRLRREQEMRLFFKEILLEAGYGDAELVAIPNGYCPCEHCAPWFRFKTHLGEITIGWRKRVINIDWSDTGQDLHLLFCSEDVTKGPHHIHAWSKEKAIDYLMRIWLTFFRREAR